MRFVGIDVSKAKLNMEILEPAWHGEFANTAAGHREIVRRLARDAEPCRVVVEATATYSEGIAVALARAPRVEVMVANPRSTRNFAKALDQRGKNDGMDTRMLAAYASIMPFEPWVQPPEALRTLRNLTRRRLQLVEQQTEEKVRLQEAKCAVRADVFIIEDIQAHLEILAARITRIEEAAVAHVKAHQELDRWRHQLCSVPGIADVTALTIIAELGHVVDDMDVRQLTAYTGLDPKPHQSGTMDARRQISKRGNKRLRTALYLAAWNTSRHAPEVGRWRQRLIDRGKNAKLADIAVARRLLHAIKGMRKTNTDWDGSKFFSGVPDA